MNKLKFPEKVPSLIALSIVIVIWFLIPIPDGVKPQAWHLFAIFAGTIAAIIGKAMPIGALSVLAITAVALTGVTNDSPKLAALDAISGFSNGLIWLIGLAIMISQSLTKTNLGKRVGYYTIKLFGKSTLGVGYALTISELFLAPITPSNTARGGGIIHPIMRSIADSFGSSKKDGTENKIGRYLALVNYNANPITSAMFITATAPNPLVVNLISDLTNNDIHITWGQWALAALVPGLVALVVMPLIVYWLNTPEIKSTPSAPKLAKEKLAEMGPMDIAEKVVLGVFALMLIFWAGVPAMIFGAEYTTYTTSVAFLGLSILLVTGVLDWDDILGNKTAWDTIFWFAALVMMATFLNKLGLTTWFASMIESGLGNLGLSWQASTAILMLLYFYAHYFFASTTAHIVALFSAFFTAGLALGAPPMFLALLFSGASALMSSITHYGTGTAPIIFSSGYATLSQWWKTGFIMSVVNISIWVVIGGAWWKVLGLW